MRRLRLACLNKHIDRLIADVPAIRVHWVRRQDDARVVRYPDDDVVFEIHLPMIYSASDYAVALHELGHVHGRDQQASLVERERGAWQWAREHAIIWLEMEYTAQVALMHLQSHRFSIRYAGVLPDNLMTPGGLIN